MRYVIGLGTGRCGTASLAALLAAQDGAHVSHEEAPVIPWRPSQADQARIIRWLQAQPGPVAGDVAHAWISLLPQLADHKAVRCVALHRPVESTVRSFCAHMPAEYMQSDRKKGAQQFPTYDLPAEAAWRRYVEQYHTRLHGLGRQGHVTVLPMHDLNTRVGQRRILRAAGIPRQRHTYLDQCHHNATVHA